MCHTSDYKIIILVKQVTSHCCVLVHTHSSLNRRICAKQGAYPNNMTPAMSVQALNIWHFQNKLHATCNIFVIKKQWVFPYKLCDVLCTGSCSHQTWRWGAQQSKHWNIHGCSQMVTPCSENGQRHQTKTRTKDPQYEWWACTGASMVAAKWWLLARKTASTTKQKREQKTHNMSGERENDVYYAITTLHHHRWFCER
jgi:hypothetical protein